MKAGKIWGKTELIHANGVLEFHRIEYKKNVACSKHRHNYKWNGFFVESGKMMVRVWQQGKQEGLIDETILNAGDFTRVKPGLFHEFIGLEDGVAFELYWAEFSHEDIERESQGRPVNEDVTFKASVIDNVYTGSVGDEMTLVTGYKDD
jgi:mannose-6-phosphate isomerase-like protein (cupin superfamily)